LKFSKSPTVSSSVPSLARPPTNYLNYFPYITVQSPSDSVHSLSKIPAYLAIAMAVLLLSPVTILTLTPASWQAATASLIPSLSGSLIPTRPTMQRSLSISSHSSGTDETYL